MSFADRLAHAQRSRLPQPADSEAPSVNGKHHRGRHTPGDPFAELKRKVHAALLESLGPKLYDSRMTQSELEQKVRHSLQ